MATCAQQPGLLISEPDTVGPDTVKTCSYHLEPEKAKSSARLISSDSPANSACQSSVWPGNGALKPHALR